MAKQTAKKPAAKKTVAKKTATKTTKKPSVKKVAAAPVAEKHACACDKNCACGGHCHEHGACHHHQGGFFKKLILFIIIFALGFATAKICCCNKGGFGPRPEFENGCMLIKCPKMAQMAPMIDTNRDGCITKEEFRVFKKAMRQHKNARVSK